MVLEPYRLSNKKFGVKIGRIYEIVWKKKRKNLRNCV
jgi:hypothetical protein